MRQPTTLAEFEDVLAEGKREGKTVVVDFTATWCGPCQRIAPTYAALEQEFRHVIFIKVDVDENQETARHCSIKAMPTFKVFREGKEAETMQVQYPLGQHRRPAALRRAGRIATARPVAFTGGEPGRSEGDGPEAHGRKVGHSRLRPDAWWRRTQCTAGCRERAREAAGRARNARALASSACARMCERVRARRAARAALGANARARDTHGGTYVVHPRVRSASASRHNQHSSARRAAAKWHSGPRAATTCCACVCL